MRLLTLAVILPALLIPTASVAADPCRSIVAATIAELRAGAVVWDEAIEALVRSAAGSSCVKTLSGSYAVMETRLMPTGVDMASTEVQGITVTDTEAPTLEPKEGKAGWKFLGFDVNTVPGSPGRKPYERKH
jgi:hypothetical protein